MAKKATSSKASGSSRAAKSHTKRKTSSTKTPRKSGGTSGSKRAPAKKKASDSAPRKTESRAKGKTKKVIKTKSKAKTRTKKSAAKASPRAVRGARKGGKAEKSYLFLDHSAEDLFANQLLEELEFRHGIDVATIDLRIRDGMAVARGCVSDFEELEAVRETMQDAGGITDLTFVVQVSPDRREADRDRARHIQERLDGEADLAAENVVVACIGRKAVVRGTVGSRLRKQKAGLLALRHGDVGRVANRVVVL